MRTKWESSKAWLSENIVTQTSVKPHAGAGCWRHITQATLYVTNVCTCSLCEHWWSWSDFATGYHRLAFNIS